MKKLILNEKYPILKEIKKGKRYPEYKGKELKYLFPAETAFKLHATYGYPIEMTLLDTLERHMLIDMKEFETIMEKEKRKNKWRINM